MKTMSLEEVKKKIMNEVKHEKIQEVEINKSGNVVFKTKWFRYECKLKEKNGTISFKLLESGHPGLVIAAILGLIILIPTVAVIILAILEMPVKKEIKRQVNNILAQ